MRFQIPQFIDVEDKIFGPLTLKQFIYLAGAGAAALALVTIFGVFFGLVLASPIVVLAMALSFYKINNRPFIYTLESAFKYMTKDKLYIWNKKEPGEDEKSAKDSSPSGGKFSSLIVPNLSESRLKDMNWELDVKKNEDEMLEKSSK